MRLWETMVAFAIIETVLDKCCEQCKDFLAFLLGTLRENLTKRKKANDEYTDIWHQEVQ